MEIMGKKIKILGNGDGEEYQVVRNFNHPWLFQVHMLSQIYFNLAPEERDRIRKLEMFDEFEEFFLKCSHYFVIVATKVREGKS